MVTNILSLLVVLKIKSLFVFFNVILGTISTAGLGLTEGDADSLLEGLTLEDSDELGLILGETELLGL